MNFGSELFRWFVEASTDGLWLLDERGNTLFANRRMAELLGRDSEDLTGFSAYDAHDADGRHQMDLHLADMVAGSSGEENVETLLVRPDGSSIWALVSWQPLLDDDGARVGWLHRVAEYTERKTLLETLREREHQLATAQRIAHIGSWEWDVPSDTVAWSDELYRMYNLEPQEFLATYQGFLDFVHPDDRPEVQQQIESTFTGADEFSFDARIIRKGGEIRWIRGLGFVERGPDGTPVKMGGTSQDVTDLARADHLAAEATRRLELLRTMATAANQTNNLTEALQLAAIGVPHYTGWEALAIYVMGATGTLETTPLPPDATRSGVAPLPGLAERARDTGEVVSVPQPGHEETHSVVAVPVKLDGRVTCVVELLADEVPPDDNSMKLINQISSQLSQVAQRAAVAVELAEARDQAMEASRLKSEFLATMSHEIRTPMNGVIGLNDLLMRTDLDAHQLRLAEGLQSAGLTLLAIINDILDLSKIEAGKLELEEADFDLRTVFDRVGDVLGEPAREKGLELVVACHPDVPERLRGDSVRLGQVVSNLTSNAIKFTDSGEVVVQAQVDHRTASGDVVLRVTVTDTGVGIPLDTQDGLFDPFTQADPSTTRRHGGTGLGLAISRRLVDALGGELSVTSEVGSGSTFAFTAVLGQPTSPSPRRRTTPAALQGRRVLVVDDNTTNRFILTEQLSAWEMEPVSVGSGTAAIAALLRAVDDGEPFEIALLDLYLLDTDGIDLARRIRAEPRYRGLKMVLLSSGHDLDLSAARAAGISQSITKPVRHADLHESLEALVGPGTAEPEAEPADAEPATTQTVLVVEDNRVNQMVATGLLDSLGYHSEVAQDGIEAVEMLTHPHAYAAVLMDCRMPRLDGYDATRRIRQAEPEGTRVPIIAMTASALEGERERCLEAGMDDFLTKPVERAQLEAMMRLWARGETAAGPTPEGAPDEPGPDVLDRSRVQMLDGLVKDGVSFFERTAASFLSRVGEQVQAIRDAVLARDAAGLTAAAHLLKGSALNLGLPLVGAAAARLEELGDEGRTDGAAEPLLQLAHEVDRAVAALRAAMTGAR
ncbi:MAG: sensor hybrid histidine kinase [Nocardioides sp.]|nr:sensor hybrid histidine kinase [Nocardioides sp.]